MTNRPVSITNTSTTSNNSTSLLGPTLDGDGSGRSRGIGDATTLPKYQSLLAEPRMEKDVTEVPNKRLLEEDTCCAGTHNNKHHPKQKSLFSWSRTAGGLYVVIILCGMTSQVAFRGPLLTSDAAAEDSSSPAAAAAATYERLVAAPHKLRTSLLMDVLMSVCDVHVAVILAYVLTQAGANTVLTALTTTFRLLQQAVLMTNLIHLIVVLLLVDPDLASYHIVTAALSLFTPNVDDVTSGSNQSSGTNTLAPLAVLFLHVHMYGYALAMSFFAGALLTLGILLYGSRIYPLWLAVALMLAGTGYLLDTIAYFVLTNYNGDTTLSQIFMLPVLVGEVGLALALLWRPPVCCV